MLPTGRGTRAAGDRRPHGVTLGAGPTTRASTSRPRAAVLGDLRVAEAPTFWLLCRDGPVHRIPCCSTASRYPRPPRAGSIPPLHSANQRSHQMLIDVLENELRRTFARGCCRDHDPRHALQRLLRPDYHPGRSNRRSPQHHRRSASHALVLVLAYPSDRLHARQRTGTIRTAAFTLVKQRHGTATLTFSLTCCSTPARCKKISPKAVIPAKVTVGRSAPPIRRPPVSRRLCPSRSSSSAWPAPGRDNQSRLDTRPDRAELRHLPDRRS